MTTSKYGALILVLFVCAATGVAQTKEITRDEYYASFRAALQKARGLSRRHLSRTEIYKDGKSSRTDEWLYEYVLPDKIRYLHTETDGQKVRRTEQIDIGEIKYCKRDGGDWEKVASSCIGGETSGIPNSVSSKYSVQKVNLDGREAVLYRQYISYKDTWSKNKDSEGLSFYETEYWLNRDGLIVREEYRRGLIDPKRIDRTTIDTTEYDPGIKIEAPIK